VHQVGFHYTLDTRALGHSGFQRMDRVPLDRT